MYKNVLVPMDGSKLAECVLPHVEALSRAGLVEGITFVRVVESPRVEAKPEGSSLPKGWKLMYSEGVTEAADYLMALLARLKYDSVKLKAQVLEGQAAEQIADYAAKNAVDLIVIATHGRSGLSRWVWGSVAERVLISSSVPVLMVTVQACQEKT